MARVAGIRAAAIFFILLLGAGCSPPDLGSGGGKDTEVPKDTGGDSEIDAPKTDAPEPDQATPDTGTGDLATEIGEPDTACDPGSFCDDKECGPDPCGGQCKTTCWAHQECFAWVCRGEGQLGFSCADDGDCDSGHCVPWDGDAVCTIYCEDDGACEHPDWTCEVAFGGAYCMPPCEALTCEDLDATCGAPEDGCFGALDCGACPGENQACDDTDWSCVCAFEACGDTCCAEGEDCIDGSCWNGPKPCDPPCGAGETCGDDGACLPCCTFGAYCDAEAACLDGLICKAGTCCHAADATCDGVDDDCDGVADEDYVPDASCGLGPCHEGNVPSSCSAGIESPCTPGAPIGASDATCDGVDDDCDGDVDEDYVPDASCGIGPCQETNTPSSCQAGVESPCQPGVPLSEEDVTCNGYDDDCDGDVDEEYVSIDDCGAGWCKTNNVASACVDGIEIPCAPGEALEDEATCNGVDDDCDGATDEDFPEDATCGVGACKLFNTPASCVAGVETPCLPGEAALADTICNGLDDDCDGDADEDFIPFTTCGTGWCRVTNVPSTCEDGVETLCVPGLPLADLDVSCDSIDSDCDGLTDEDADPPCSFGAPVVGADVVFLTTGGLASGIVTDEGDGTYTTRIFDLSASGFEGLVTAQVGDKSSTPKGFTVVSGIPVETTLYLSRDLVYGDDPLVRGCLHTTDALGTPAGPGFEAGFLLAIDDLEIPVDATYAGDGFYCGWVEIPQALFESWTEAEISGWIEALGTPPRTLTIAAAPGYAPLDVGEVSITIPLGPVAVGEVFEVPVVVNSGSHAISAYNVSVSFDESVLEVLTVAQGAATDLSIPTSNSATEANAIGKLSFNAINQNPAGGTAQGEAVEVAVITFAVRADASPGATAALSGDVYELLDTLYDDFSASPDMTVRGPSGSGILDQVEVDQVVLRAIQPVPNPPTLLDLSALTGAVPVATVEVLAFRSDGTLSLVSGDEIPACAVDDPGIASEDACLLTAVSPGVTAVSATVGELSGEAVVRVAGLETPLDAAALDPTLQYIFELDTVQATRLRVLGEVSDGDLYSDTLDVTALSDFISSEPDIVTVTGDGIVLPGINGAAEIDVLGHGGAVLGTAPVEVLGADVVQVDDLLVVVPAHVELASLVPEPVPTDVAATVATAKVTNLLSGEGHQVQTRTLLIFSDDEETGGGSRMDVTGTDLVGFQSGIDGIGTVDQDGVITAVGAGETDVYAVFTDVWGDAVADDTKPFSVELPPPVAVEISVADPRVAVGIDDRAWTVLGVQHQRPLVVEVFFPDGTVLSMAQDPRTHYEVSGDILSVPSVVDCLGVPDCSPGIAKGTGAGTGTVTVTVTFPGSYLSDMVGTIDLEVVGHEALVLASVESHTPADTTPVTESILSFIEGTAVWQDASLRLVDTFSDGSQVVLTAHPDSKYFVYQPGTDTPVTGVVLVSKGGHVTAQGTGIVNLLAKHQGESSDPIPLQVSATPVNLIGVTSYLEDGALMGVKDQATETLIVRGLFSDGTRRLLSGADRVPGLLEFESLDPGVASINDVAVLTARGNGPTVISVDVSSVADIGVPFDPPAISGILVNLEPTVGDVDLGEAQGHPFPDRPADAIFEVPVRVNTGGFLLGGLDLEIEYDPEVLQALGVVPGLQLPSVLFHGNTGESGKIYLNVNPMVGQVAFGPALEVARITFKALKNPGGAMVSPIGGTIRGVVNTSGGPLGAETPRPIVAGDGEIDPPPVTVQGDANDDEVFDVRDVQFLQWIVAEPPLEFPNQTQEAQSDVYPDGAVDMRDAYFASQVLTRLAHFVQVEAVATAPGAFDLKAWVMDRDQELVDDYVAVSFEVMPGNNLEEITFTEAHQQTASGLITEAVLLPDGAWGTHVSGLVSQENMNVVVILEVVNGVQQIMMATPFLSTPYLDTESQFTPIYAFGADWCVADCEDKTCGEADGCGGLCHGGCAGANEVCLEGVCVCGWAQCSGSCCPQGAGCDGGECCMPTTCQALGATCGTPGDGCGDTLSCGSCAPNQLCDDDSWTCACTHEECGGICCDAGEICIGSACTCVPDCAGKGCGDADGCGGLCDGPCPMEDSFCLGGACQCFYESCGDTCCGKYDGCQDGACVTICVPECFGKLCGEDNGCGDPCDGACLGENQFCQEGQCTCIHLQCAGQCCAEGQDCVAGSCL